MRNYRGINVRWTIFLSCWWRYRCFKIYTQDFPFCQFSWILCPLRISNSDVDFLNKRLRTSLTKRVMVINWPGDLWCARPRSGALGPAGNIYI